MSKLIIMRGLPASGKSTKAHELVLKMGNTVRLNKDLVREMLHFNKFTGRNESLTRDAVRTLAKSFLDQGQNVIIDDTNLNEGTMQSWMDLVKGTAHKFEVINMTATVEECVYRDSLREKSVGGTVIKNMAIRSGLKVFPQDSVVLCDIDGTIADTSHRLHYVQASLHPEGKDWKGFFSEMDKDPVRQTTRDLLIELYNAGKTIIFFSARPEDYKEVTLKWLEKNFLTFAYTLVMRKSGDKRPDTDTKRDMFNDHFRDKSVIHLVIDDRPAVIRLWESMGLKVKDVGDGVEF